jgi:hypothetical protein
MDENVTAEKESKRYVVSSKSCKLSIEEEDV